MGSVKINEGANVAPSLDVTLDIKGADPHGVASMCVSNSATTPEGCGTFQSYTSIKPWTVAPGSDGPRAVFVYLRDSRGDTMPAPAEASIAV